jgi:hypothetical protein
VAKFHVVAPLVNKETRDLKYFDFPEKYSWKMSQKNWILRQRSSLSVG